MPQLRPHLVLALLSPLALSAGPEEQQGVSLSFERPAGSTREVVAHLESERSLNAIAIFAGGEQRELEESPPSLVLTQVRHLEWNDTFEQLEDGEPTRILRAFGEVWRERTIDAEAGGAIEANSPGREDADLAERSVRFKREDGEWSAEAADDGEPLELDPLRAELELEGFLPTGLVEVGDSWDVPLESLKRALLLPGGDPFTPDDEQEQAFSQRLWESFEGELEASLAGLETDEAERSLARIDFETELEGDAERSWEREQGLTKKQLIETYEIKGVLYWDLEAQRPIKLGVRSQGTAILRELLVIPDKGAIERRSLFDTTGRYRVAFD